MRRYLVLTDESARHPFRATLPPQARDLRVEAAEPRVPWRAQLWNDVRGFAQAYCVCLAGATVFFF